KNLAHRLGNRVRRANPELRVEQLEGRLVPAGGLAAVTFAPAAHLAGPSVTPANGPGQPGGVSPAQIRHAYRFDPITFNNGTTRGDGTGQTIAIIDAYDQPNIAGDLATFDSMYGLAAPPSFTKVNQTGGTNYPAADKGWGLEISLDVEWAHATAPGA